MKKLIAVAVLLCAAKTYAADVPQIDWNKDPVRQTVAYLDQEEAGSVELVVVQQPAAQADEGPIRIEAAALGTGLLSQNSGYDVTRSVELVLNNDKDRVGAQVSSCEPGPGGDSGDSCDYADFVFPQLSVDKANGRILLGSETVATFHKGFLSLETSIKLEPSFKLGFRREPVKVDGGFDRVMKDKYSVTLERVSK